MRLIVTRGSVSYTGRGTTRQQLGRGAHRPRCRRARPEHGQLTAVHEVEIERAAGGERDQRPAGLEPRQRLAGARRRAQNRRVDQAVGLGRAPAVRARLEREHLVAAGTEHGREQPSDEAAADDEHAPARDVLERTQHARERLNVCADGVVDRVRQLDPVGARDPFGEAAGQDCRRREPLAGRFVPGEATLALAAGLVMDEREAAAVDADDDLVAQHEARSSPPELLEVRAAEPDRQHRHGRLGLVDLRQRRPSGRV